MGILENTVQWMLSVAEYTGMTMMMKLSWDQMSINRLCPTEETMIVKKRCPAITSMVMTTCQCARSLRWWHLRRQFLYIFCTVWKAKQGNDDGELEEESDIDDKQGECLPLRLKKFKEATGAHTPSLGDAPVLSWKNRLCARSHSNWLHNRDNVTRLQSSSCT